MKRIGLVMVLLAKLVMRAKLRRVNLASAHKALGRHAYEAGTYRDTLPEAHTEIDHIYNTVTGIEKRLADIPEAKDVTDKAKAMAGIIRSRLQIWLIKSKIASRMRKLGRAAFEHGGKASGPDELVQPVVGCLARIEQITEQIAEQIAELRAGRKAEPNQSTDLIDRVRTSIPAANYRVETNVTATNVGAGTILKAILARLPNSEASVEGGDLVVRNLDRSLKLGVLDMFRNSMLDIDRKLWDITGRISVEETDDTTAITAEVHQGWTRLAAILLAYVPLFGWAVVFNVFVRTRLFGNRRVRRAVQRILDDEAKKLQRNVANERLTAALDSLT